MTERKTPREIAIDISNDDYLNNGFLADRVEQAIAAERSGYVSYTPSSDGLYDVAIGKTRSMLRVRNGTFVTDREMELAEENRVLAEALNQIINSPYVEVGWQQGGVRSAQSMCDIAKKAISASPLTAAHMKVYEAKERVIKFAHRCYKGFKEDVATVPGSYAAADLIKGFEDLEAAEKRLNDEA